MFKGMLAFLSVAFLTTCLEAQSSAPSFPAEKARLAVVEFQTKGNLDVKDAGQIVADLVLSRFAQDRYQLVERSQLATILAEQDLTLAMLRYNPQVIYGKLKSVKYLVLGSVAKLDSIVVTARLVDAVTGEIRQTAELSAADMGELQDMAGELARILQMTSVEKKAYLDQSTCPTLVAEARKKAAAKDYVGAIATYRHAIAINPTAELRAEIQKIQSQRYTGIHVTFCISDCYHLVDQEIEGKLRTIFTKNGMMLAQDYWAVNKMLSPGIPPNSTSWKKAGKLALFKACDEGDVAEAARLGKLTKTDLIVYGNFTSSGTSRGNFELKAIEVASGNLLTEQTSNLSPVVVFGARGVPESVKDSPVFEEMFNSIMKAWEQSHPATANKP